MPKLPDVTGDKQISTRFQKGTSGNPAGRPKGARSKLGEEFIETLASDFASHGVSVIEKVRVRSPEVYLKLVSNILPRETVAAAFNVNVDTQKEFDGAQSVEEILQIVAKEAGPDAARGLANIFEIEFEEEASGQVIDQ